MAITNLSNQYISSSFQTLMQVSSSNAIFNGAGNQITTLLVSASYAATSSYALNAAAGTQGTTGAQGVQGLNGLFAGQGASGIQGVQGLLGTSGVTVIPQTPSPGMTPTTTPTDGTVVWDNNLGSPSNDGRLWIYNGRTGAWKFIDVQ